MFDEWYETEAGVLDRLNFIVQVGRVSWHVHNARYIELTQATAEQAQIAALPLMGLDQLGWTWRQHGCVCVQAIYDPHYLAHWGVGGRSKRAAVLAEVKDFLSMGKQRSPSRYRHYAPEYRLFWALQAGQPLPYITNWPNSKFQITPETIVKMVRPEWVWRKHWNTQHVVGLAEGIFADRGAGGRGPILADALEEAGCDDYRILDYLRTEPLFIGDWVLEHATGRVEKYPE